MTKLVSQTNSTIIKDNVVLGSLPNTNSNDILLYNKKQTERKLKEISNSDKAEKIEITKIIGQWGYALGITVVSQDLLTLNNFIRESFPNLNIFDLKVCVKLVSVDSDLLQTDAEHYGKLTMIYVSKVLKAYEKYRSSICFGVQEKVTKFIEDNKPPMSKEERLKNFKELLTDAKQTRVKGEIYEDLGEVIYNFIKHSMSDFKRGNLKKLVNDVSFTSTKKEDMVKRDARRYVSNFWVEKMNLELMLKNLTYEMLLY
jgi:hypothetical protein